MHYFKQNDAIIRNVLFYIRKYFVHCLLMSLKNTGTAEVYMGGLYNGDGFTFVYACVFKNCNPPSPHYFETTTKRKNKKPWLWYHRIDWIRMKTDKKLRWFRSSPKKWSTLLKLISQCDLTIFTVHKMYNIYAKFH